MFLTNVLFNRRESPYVLRSQSGQSGRVAKPGVKTSRVVREKVYLATLMTILMTFRAYLLAPSAMMK
jgi:hypothetical protein